jgi:hypothetical protein
MEKKFFFSIKLFIIIGLHLRLHTICAVQILFGDCMVLLVAIAILEKRKKKKKKSEKEAIQALELTEKDILQLK